MTTEHFTVEAGQPRRFSNKGIDWRQQAITPLPHRTQ